MIEKFASAASVLFLAASGLDSNCASAADVVGAHPGKTVDWPVYGGNSANDHYSNLSEIDRANVHKLKLAWTFDTGELSEGSGLAVNPLIVGKVLYGYTPSQKVFALDAANGKLLWKFDSGIVGQQPIRGLAYWKQGGDRRVLANVTHHLYAIDAGTGKPIPGFGTDGRIDLRKHLRDDFEQVSCEPTSPGIVYKTLIIIGCAMPESLPATPGDIRAYDVSTGALRWSFHTIPRPGEFGYETWSAESWKTSGAANNWCGMSLDAERGIVYVPTGSAASDFYGADRIGDNLFANTLLALDANTGKRLWHFQGVHHDLWDRDFPAAPSLFTAIRDGRRIDAVAQTTKQGYLFVFDRVTGEPLFPIKEQPRPASKIPGEIASRTQPRPTLPEPYARQLLTQELLTTRTQQAHEWVSKRFRTFRSEGPFAPWSENQESVVLPGFDGGAEWGGAAVDIKNGVIYINSNDVPWTTGLVKLETTSPGEKTYKSACSGCHGLDRRGSSGFPSLVGISGRLTDEQFTAIIRRGKGRMPSFAWLGPEGATVFSELLLYLNSESSSSNGPLDRSGRMMSEPRVGQARPASDHSSPQYVSMGYNKFLDPDGYPAIVPPWGTLNAIDLNTGKYLWKIPLGEYPELVAQGLKGTGSENYGGPIVTAGGVVFIGATIFDNKFLAFDARYVKRLWETMLPGAGRATPATYRVDGKQFVVIATGGARFVSRAVPPRGVYVAFALSE